MTKDRTLRLVQGERKPERPRPAVITRGQISAYYRRRVQRSFRDLWSNEDATLNKVAGNVMQGRHEWLGQGRMDLGFTAESFRTRYISESKTEEKPRVAAASSGAASW